MISAQDFRNKYEKFYSLFRMYLWPYNVLEDLAETEVEIYTAFFDKDKLKRYLDRLWKPVKEASEDYEDEDLMESYNEIVDLLEEVNPEEMFHTLERVEEVNPDEDKKIPTEEPDSDEEDSEGEFTNDYSYDITGEGTSE